MESFKVYLPSNACPNLFPDNTPTDYRIHFDKPIELDGKWEVGTESVTYSSHINDEKERSEIRLNVDWREDLMVNAHYPYEFITTDPDPSIGLWKGFDGILPRDFEKDVTKIQSVVDTLNSMNYDMLKAEKVSENGQLFKFEFNDKGHVKYASQDRAFVLQLTNVMAKVLGFDYVTVFHGSRMNALHKPPKDLKALKQEDYLLRYMHMNCQESGRRLYLKVFGHGFDGKEETFLALWKRVVTSAVGIKAEFSNGKLVLHNFNPNLGIRFSLHFARRFHQPAPFFGRGSRWATHKALLKKGIIEEEQWYIDVYSEKMEVTEEQKFADFSLDFYPWRCKTMKQVLRLINSRIQKLLRLKLKTSYDADKHHFFLTLNDTSEHCKLTLGPWLSSCNMSKNLSYLLGFPDKEMNSGENLAVREVDSLSNHSRQLHLTSNVIQPTAYGKHQRQILCDFLHTRNVEPITEKRFDPISYHPVARNGIDMIRVQLTDDLYNPISIQDSTTIVTLYFRKAK